MLFTIGSILLIVGLIIASYNQGVFMVNRIELVGIVMSWVGLVVMASSIWILTWKYLP
jgi:hypothetical protein